MPLEPFFKDKARCESHRDISLHLSPQRGHPMISDHALFTSVLSWFACFAASPTSVGFMARAAVDVFKPRSPKTSLIAHAKTSSRTDGFIRLKDTMSLISMDGFGRVHDQCRPQAGNDGLGAPRLGRLGLLPGIPPHPDTPSAGALQPQSIPRLRLRG